jgi:hypothetical protein
VTAKSIKPDIDAHKVSPLGPMNESTPIDDVISAGTLNERVRLSFCVEQEQQIHWSQAFADLLRLKVNTPLR